MSSHADAPPEYTAPADPADNERQIRSAPSEPRIRDFAYEHGRNGNRGRPSFIPVNIRLGRTTYTQMNPQYIDLVLNELLNFSEMPEGYPPMRAFLRTTPSSAVYRTIQTSGTRQRCKSDPAAHHVATFTDHASASAAALANDRRRAKQRERNLHDLLVLRRLAIAALCLLGTSTVLALVLRAVEIAEIGQTVADALSRFLYDVDGTGWSNWSAPALVLAGFVASVAGLGIMAVTAVLILSFLGGRGAIATTITTVSSAMTTSITSTPTTLSTTT